MYIYRYIYIYIYIYMYVYIYIYIHLLHFQYTHYTIVLMRRSWLCLGARVKGALCAYVI